MKELKAVVFDLDGVITNTAKVHAKAWKQTFDDYLKLREKRDQEPFKEFTIEGDYRTYVDGKPRYKGVRSFLESRGINLAEGDLSDEPGKETVCGLGNTKNGAFRKVLKKDGAEVFQPAVDLLKDLKAKGIHIGVASSSKNCLIILQSVGLESIFETRIDGVVSAEMGLKGKPEPDIFTVAAKNMNCTPDVSIVVEDAVSGVQAGAKGQFGLVLGIARENNEKELKENGADVVVTNFQVVNTETLKKWFREKNG
ncbi:MAG: beta-phosphoglucomutase family hydrolase [Candidatus Omnitrophota bacterium]